MLNGLDLFSGIGGISVALAPWVRPIAYCENDRYAQSVLLSRIAGGDIPSAPIWDDVQTLRGDMLPTVDIIYGGFPCQDISDAGARAGLGGKRSGLVFEILRLVGECRPRFVFLENVPRIDIRGLDRLLLEFNELGYDARWTIVSAREMGAPHRRERFWLLAHANGEPRRLSNEAGSKVSEARGSGQTMADSDRIGWDEGSNDLQAREPIPSPHGEDDLADTYCERLEARRQGRSPESGGRSVFGGQSWWESEPDVGRVAHGVLHRVDRLRGLGNAVVPAQAREAFQRLAGL